MSGGQFRLNLLQSSRKNASIRLTMARVFAESGYIYTSKKAIETFIKLRSLF